MKIENFCEFDFIKKRFNPLTPYGKSFKENIQLITDKEVLFKKYEAINLVLKFKKNKKIAHDKIKYHLKNIPYISNLKTPNDVADIFLIKKFINNYYFIFCNLPQNLKDFFCFKWELDEFFELLNIDGISDTFYISDKYDTNLIKLRKQLLEILNLLFRVKDEFKKIIENKFGLMLNGDFIVIDSSKFLPDMNDYFIIDVYDSKKILLKPKYGNEYVELLKKREEIVANIKEIESNVVKKIIEEIKKNFQKIILCINPIFDLDVAIASCELCEEFNLKKPDLNSSKIVIENGIFIPLKITLNEMNIEYTPLTFTFDKKINIIQGSNMGGKTVVLKTITFLQYMAQCGFFVPASKFKTQIFKKIVITSNEEEIKGLSSFAYEVYQMSNEIENIDDKFPLLVISDEFAKTTNFNEAVAIINSLLDFFSSKKNIYFFLATHFGGIKNDENISFLKMKGFNREKYLKSKHIQQKDIREKIKFINKYMDYEIVKVNNSNIVSSDAIDIAEIIGMNSKICENAKKYLEENYEENKNKQKNKVSKS
ncbi:MAG: hypothetical protein N2Z20_05165 [Elusimicrobiales bacterium]|nr:hypothetical protein [Elusimicrobiales bacterium]